MKNLDHLPVLIPSARRNEWKERLCNSSKNASCTLKECVQWDSGYNSADNEPLNSRREKDQENYFVWMNEFCEHLDPEVEETLLLLHRKGGCMPCIGRLIYQYLRSEFLKTFMVCQEHFETLRQSPDFPDNLRKPKGRIERKLRDALMDSITNGLVQAVVSQCAHPYYERLALLLNHGRSFPTHLLGGVIGANRFHLIDVEYNEAMLRTRANRADPLGSFTSLTHGLSLESSQNLARYMRNRGK